MTSVHEKAVDFSVIPDINQDDIAFLSDMFTRFPRVVAGYRRFTQTKPDDRIPLAAKILETQPRTGWQLRFEEVPAIYRPILVTHANEYYGKRILINEATPAASESVLEHCAEAQELFIKVYRKSTHAHLQWGAECMKFHDFHEAIDGDFTPHCAISKEEKKRLETISTKLLCEAKTTGSLLTEHIWNCTQLFEGKVEDFEANRQTMLQNIATQRAQGLIKPYQETTVGFLEKLYAQSNGLDVKLLHKRVADMDALHMAIRSCRMVKEKHIKPENRDKMEEFWTYIEKKLQTPEAQIFFDAFRAAYLDDKLTYQMAVTNASNSVSGGRRFT